MRAAILATLSLVAFVIPAAQAQTPGNPMRGQAYVEERCAECHAVAASKGVSPRMGAPSFMAIANAPGMTATALLVWLNTSHRKMPNLIVSDDRQDDVIAYILTLRREP